MLDPDWALTRPVLWIAVVAALAILVWRARRKDRREYRRFKRFRSTVKRQAMFRRWLGESFITFGGISVALLLLGGAHLVPLLRELQAWPVLSDIRAAPGLTIGLTLALAVGLAVLTWFAVRAARAEGEGVTSIGDIQALLPRNRQELRLGALLSINAGVVEELAFRLALPAVIFGASGSAVAAVVGSVLLFGALHVYQGVWGVVGTTLVGALLMATYVVSGTIVVPIVLHALFDLRSLVLIPMAVLGVHRVDGVRPVVMVTPSAPPADPASSPVE